jgi:RNA polymerase sigma-70 factor (ECF subfamily)
MYPTRAIGRTPTDADDAEELRGQERRAIEQVLAGERAAFRLLVERHHRAVHAVIYRMVHNGADADDLTQQAFIAAFDALGRFQLDARFAPWIMRIGVNLAKDHLKSKKRGELGLDEARPSDEPMFAGALPTPERAVLGSERQRLLERALMSLSVDDREILVLKDVEELSFDEIKQILRKPITALKIRAVRARARLRAALERMGEKEQP